MKEFQERAVEFARENGLDAPVEYRALDFIAEAGEIVSDITKSAEYGESPGQVEVKEDEIGDLLFSLFLLAEELGISSEEAFNEALEKYEERVSDKGDPGSK